MAQNFGDFHHLHFFLIYFDFLNAAIPFIYLCMAEMH